MVNAKLPKQTHQPFIRGYSTMTTVNAPLPRSERLRLWMTAHNITDAAIGKHLGITAQAVNKFLLRDTMPVRHHIKCLELGFPEELLPAPYDRPRGRRALAPHFPGLAAQEPHHI